MKTLTVSIAHLDPNIVAREVATFEPDAKVTGGHCIVAGETERQAVIEFPDATFSEVWRVWSFLKRSWGLTCAWFDDGHGFAGCILKYSRRPALTLYRGPSVSTWAPGDIFPLDGDRGRQVGS